MVVDEDHRSHASADQASEDVARVNLNAGEASPSGHLVEDDAMSHVETEYPELLDRQAGQARLHVLVDVARHGHAASDPGTCPHAGASELEGGSDYARAFARQARTHEIRLGGVGQTAQTAELRQDGDRPHRIAREDLAHQASCPVGPLGAAGRWRTCGGGGAGRGTAPVSGGRGGRNRPRGEAIPGLPWRRVSEALGVDGVTWGEYGQDLEVRLADLHARVQRGTYRAKASRRVYIPKPDGRQRPLGIASLEDKIVQRAVVEVLNAIYEADFLGFSYGFRPGRSQHQGLDALATATMRKKVNWVLDADIRGFFDAIDHGWMVKFVEHRVADKRVLRLIQKWLAAGILEDGEWSRTNAGTPQGATVSPLLANVYLHYVLDLWVQQWRKRVARGEVIIVRYADDFVMGFQHEVDAVRFRADLQKRLEQFGLEAHPDKTRLLRFGRFAERDRRERGEGRPETFDFLGLRTSAGRRRVGRFCCSGAPRRPECVRR